MSKYKEDDGFICTEYSLVKHLNLLCSQDEKYKDLYAVWTLDQEIYSNALSTVALSFPHYSMHDAKHSASIINKIEMLLGEERIKSLSPTDTFMILECAYLHDFGMIVANSELVEEWGKPSFQRFLRSLQDSTYDEEVAKAASYLLNFQDKEVEYTGNAKWPVEVKNCVTVISAEYFRKRHNIRSANWIDNPKGLGIDINFNKLIPERIMKLIGRVAISHGTDFDSTFNSLERVDNGIGTDQIHPRFIACLLRLGDLLDLDNGRFNPVNEKISPFPKSSELHRDKHASITHFLVCPEKIEVSAVCQDEKVYRVTREWFDSLKEELKDLSSRWSQIVPQDFQGGPPSLGEIKLSIKDAQQITEQLDLRFSIDQKRAFELIEGSGIYDSQLIFIRELIQNALDATKIQMWKDIISGKYDNITIGKYTNRKISEERDKLFFYDQIPQEIRNLYPINIEIIYRDPKKCKDENGEYAKEAEYIFKIEDRGCGISINDLKRMESVGGSWNQDDNLADFIESMPVSLRPTGSFGLGLHSVFMVTDEIKINTKSEDDKAYDIGFVSRRKNGYIAVKENPHRRNTGTEIYVSIKNSVIKTALEGISKRGDLWIGSRKISEGFKKYDYFDDRFQRNTNQKKLAAYINNFIENIRIFEVNCIIDKKFIDGYKVPTKKYNDSTKDINDKILVKEYPFNENGLSYYIYFDTKGLLKTEVRDKRTSAIISFSACKAIVQSDNGYWNISGSDGGSRVMFRDIPCDNGFGTEYFNIELNILDNEAKSVLDVARNSVKSSIMRGYLKRLAEIRIDYFNTLKNIYLNDKNPKNENETIEQAINNIILKSGEYFESSMFMFRLAYNHYCGEVLKSDWGNDFVIDKCKKIINGKLSEDRVSFKDFINSKDFILYEWRSLGCQDDLVRFVDKLRREGNFNSIIFRSDYDMIRYGFEDKYLLKNFRVTRYERISSSEFIIVEKENTATERHALVLTETDAYTNMMQSLVSDYWFRNVIYPLRYNGKFCIYECLVVDSVPEDSNVSVELLFDKYFIISPFININEEDIGEDVDALVDWLKKEANFDGLVRFVVINSVKNKGKNIKAEDLENRGELIKEVEDAYKQLIKDYIDVKNGLYHKEIDEFEKGEQAQMAENEVMTDQVLDQEE